MFGLYIIDVTASFLATSVILIALLEILQGELVNIQIKNGSRDLVSTK